MVQWSILSALSKPYLFLPLIDLAARIKLLTLVSFFYKTQSQDIAGSVSWLRLDSELDIVP